MKQIKPIMILLISLSCSIVESQTISKIHASITTDTQEFGIKYSDAERILKTETPNSQFLFEDNSVLVKIYNIENKIITLFINKSGEMIAWQSKSNKA